MNIRKLSILALGLGCFVVNAGITHAEPAQIEVCVACHGKDGSGAGFDNVPIIAGTPAAHLEEALYAYQDGARHCVAAPAMCQIAATLSEADIVELAEYFSAMSRISSDEAFDATLARAGERIHQEQCSKCHLLPDDEETEFAVGIPLHGQRSAYLKVALEAYLAGDRDTLAPAMADALGRLDDADIEALINFYASYEP